MSPRQKHIVRTGPRAVSVGPFVQDFAASLRRCRDFETAWQAIIDGYAACGIEFVIYMFMRPSAPQDGGIVRTTLPAWWTNYYSDSESSRRDPFFKTCRSFALTGTGKVFVDDHVDILTASERQFIREASETGMISGIASPVRLCSSGPFGGWNLGTRMQRPAFETFIADCGERLQLMGFMAHEVLQRTRPRPDGKAAGARLTGRERECLLWLATGLRTGEIAERLNIAAVTVDLHFRRIRGKLGAATREEALAKAICSGEIAP